MSDSGTAWRPTVPGYEIVREIGRGGFAVVYEAIQTSIDRPVALKVINLGGINADTLRRFRAECRTVGRLSRHPHVIALYDAGETAEGAPYLAMEMCPEGSLGDRVDRDGSLSSDEVIKVGLEVASALTAAHEAGIVHRDIKPDNLMIGYSGEVLLADFGIATLTDGTASASGSFVGSIAYSAPELLRGQRANAVSDVYSLGTTLYTLAAGRAAFAGGPDDTPMAVVWRVGNEAAPPLPASVSAGLAEVIAKAMSKDPDERYPTTSELTRGLGDLSGPTGGGSASGAASGPWPSSEDTVKVDGPEPIPLASDALATVAMPSKDAGATPPAPLGPDDPTAVVSPTNTLGQTVPPTAPTDFTSPAPVIPSGPNPGTASARYGRRDEIHGWPEEAQGRLAAKWSRGRRSRRARVVGFIVLLFAGAVVVGFVLVLAVMPAGKSGGDDASATSTASTDPTSSTENSRIAPSGPGADADLFGTAVAGDQFSRTVTAGLGEGESVGPWTVLSGDWSVNGKEAVLSGGTPGSHGLATIDVGTTDVRAQVALTEPVMGAGLAFRVTDINNYWLWAATPGFSTFTLYRVVGDQATSVGDSGITEMGPGVRIGVSAVGSRIQLLANGVVVMEVNDPGPVATQGTGLGLGSLPEVSGAQFDDLAFRDGG